MLHIQLQSLSKERLIQPGKCIHWVGHWKGWQAWQGQEIGGFLLFIHSQIIEDNLVHFCGGNYICVQETRKWCEPIWMGCSSWPLWRAYLRRSLSDGMMVRKRFYAWMRLPTFNKAIPPAIFNLQLHSENILEWLKIIGNIKCCCGKRVTQ